MAIRITGHFSINTHLFSNLFSLSVWNWWCLRYSSCCFNLPEWVPCLQSSTWLALCRAAPKVHSHIFFTLHFWKLSFKLYFKFNLFGYQQNLMLLTNMELTHWYEFIVCSGHITLVFLIFEANACCYHYKTLTAVVNYIQWTSARFNIHQY